MINKDTLQTFSEHMRNRFALLGFPKSTVAKISKIVSQADVQDNRLILICEDNFYKEHILTPQKSEIEALVKQCFGEGVQFEITDGKRKKSFPLKPSPAPVGQDPLPSNLSPEPTQNLYPPDAMTLDKQRSQSASRSLEPDMTFKTFVRCQSNFAAYTACESVANNPGHLSNPLFLYGPTGLGKTHLLHAVGNEILKTKPDFHVLYITSNDFVNDVIHRGIKAGRMEDVRRKYRSCEVLLVDDIQFLENKDACQTEFFHIFNELCQRKKQIVITSDKFPKDIPNIEERLKSRFLQGLLLDIEPPGFEDRVALIETKAKQSLLGLDQDACFLIAKYAKTNVREIEGFLNDLMLLKGVSATWQPKDHLMPVLKKRFPSCFMGAHIDFAAIQIAVASYFQIKVADLMSPLRQKKVVLARHVAMFFSKEILNLQIVDISESFGKKDHTTALHAINKIKEMCERDPEFRAVLDILRKKIQDR